jgi:hypothetical protein
VTEQELSVKFAAVEDSELGVVEVGNAGQTEKSSGHSSY